MTEDLSANANLATSLGSPVAGESVDDWAALAHDMRTPFSLILGYCDLVRQDTQDKENLGILHAVDEIEVVARGLLERIVAFFASPNSETFAQDRDELQNLQMDFVTLTLSSLQRARGHAQLPQAQELLPDLQRIESAALQLRALSDRFAAEVIPVHANVPMSAASQASLARSYKVTQAATSLDHARNDQELVLVVDDNEANRDLMSRYLDHEGLAHAMAESGEQALRMLAAESFDLILLDMRMPGMNGFEVLRQLKADVSLRDIPVIVVSALDEMESVAACIELGAADYLLKPFNQVLLRARIKRLLEHKHLTDEQRRKTAELEVAFAEIEHQKKISEQLLFNILPQKVALELQLQGHVDPMYYEDATIVIADFVGFTLATEKLSVEELVHVLDSYFTAFDHIVDRYNLEKLKTVGDSYMLLSGIPERSPSHPVDAVLAALDMIEAVKNMSGKPVDWQVRIGIHTGPVIAGVVGIRKFAFDVWGDSINFCSRMESMGEPNRINISERTFARVKDFFACEHRGKILTKDKRDVDMYFVDGVVPTLNNSDTEFPPPAFRRRYRTYFQKDPKSFPGSFRK